MIVNLVSILTRGVVEKGRIDGEMESLVVFQKKCLSEGEEITMKRISLQHGTRDWVTVE